MYLSTETTRERYSRKSKLGKEHSYYRTRTWVIFRCDSCREVFKRPKGTINPKRLSNNYFHCCSNCDSKRFAQKKGAERRTIWDMPVSSLKNVGEL